MRRSSSGPLRLRGLAAVLALLCAASACASVDFERGTPTSGTFTSSSIAFTFLSFDVPGPAVTIARGNAADARQPNTVIRRELVFPHLGPLDFLMDILSVRYARVQGTWGIPPERVAGEAATR